MKGCRIVRGHAGGGYRGKQGLDYFAGISAESAGSEDLCLHLLVLPPGAEARPHLHENHESVIFVLEGSSSFRHGGDLEHVDTVNAGDLVHIPAGMPQQPFNRMDRPTRAFTARTDPKRAGERGPALSAARGRRPLFHVAQQQAVGTRVRHGVRSAAR